MNERSILKVQIQTILDELEWLKTALDKHQINSTLYERARNSLVNEIKKQSDSLKYVRKQFENDLALETCWASFRGAREQCLPVFRECLAYLEGVLARNAAVDDGICEIADAMLDALSHRVTIPWQRFTILAEGEFFAGMAQIIR